MVLEKTLESPLDNKQIKSILKQIKPEYYSEGLMTKLQYFGHLMQRANAPEKTLMLGKIEENGQQTMRWLDGIINLMDMCEQTPGDSEGQGNLTCCSPRSHKESNMT